MSTSSEHRACTPAPEQRDAQLHFDLAQQRLVAMRDGDVRHHRVELAFERRKVREGAERRASVSAANESSGSGARYSATGNRRVSAMR